MVQISSLCNLCITYIMLHELATSSSLCTTNRTDRRSALWYENACMRSTSPLTKFACVVSTLGDMSPTGWSWGAHRGHGVGVIHVSPGPWVLQSQGDIERKSRDRRRREGKKMRMVLLAQFKIHYAAFPGDTNNICHDKLESKYSK